MFKFGNRSLRKLEGVKPALAILASRALLYSDVDFGITEGLRTPTRQAFLVAQGRSQTMNSKHISGNAIDIVCYDEAGSITWDLEYYRHVTDCFKRAAKELQIKIQCGIDWRSFVDGPHIELR